MEKRIFSRYLIFVVLVYFATTASIIFGAHLYYYSKMKDVFIQDGTKRHKEVLQTIKEFHKDRKIGTAMIEGFAKENHIIYLKIYDSNGAYLYLTAR